MPDYKFPGKSKGTLNLSLKHGDSEVFTGLANPRAFKTGSEGYAVTGKMVGADGNAYQVSVNVVRIGSDEEGADATERQKIAALIAKDKLAARERNSKRSK